MGHGQDDPSFGYNDAAHFLMEKHNRSYYFKRVKEIWTASRKYSKMRGNLKNMFLTLRKERVHASRNPLIVHVLTDLGFMRETGEGIPRMFDEMEKNGLYPPKVEIIADSLFSVTLENQVVYSVDDLEWLKQFKKQT